MFRVVRMIVGADPWVRGCLEGWQSWSIASVLKTDEPKGSNRSNRFPSAIMILLDRQIVYLK